MKYLVSTDVYLDGILSDWKNNKGVFLIENEEGIKKTIKIWSENLDNIVLMSSLKIDWENAELTFLYTMAVVILPGQEMEKKSFQFLINMELKLIGMKAQIQE